jgi:hypothetical protein
VPRSRFSPTAATPPLYLPGGCTAVKVWRLEPRGISQVRQGQGKNERQEPMLRRSFLTVHQATVRRREPQASLTERVPDLTHGAPIKRFFEPRIMPHAGHPVGAAISGRTVVGA